ncbi:hypothetical protein [Caballeronia sp. TF1N1]|uniref:hypothetical protein n=1 Tax=Caballeronia sp. TF1N1 TaxID=2878153 RepID=UPI001FD06335|nr:hypothetical protein [Caballeronia sp. TF1N1]
MNQAKKEHQLELERLFSKNQLMSRMRHEFSVDPIFIDHAKKHGVPEKFAVDLLVQMALHKRADLPTLVGCMRHHCNKAQEVADLLLKCAQIDLVDWSPKWRQFIVKFELSETAQAEIDQFQYPLPMIVEPRELKHNAQGAYLDTDSSVILKDNHHEDDVCLDHLNRMNKVKFTLNFNTAKLIKNQWKRLDKPKEGETREEFDKRKRAFQKYDKTAHQVIDVLVKEGNEFRFTHRYCKRGRTYCQGHHVNYQGTPWNKAVIEFADKELTC